MKTKMKRRFWIRPGIWTNTRDGNNGLYYHLNGEPHKSYFDTLDDIYGYKRITLTEAKRYAKKHKIIKFK